MSHVQPSALGRPVQPSDFPADTLVHVAPRTAWFGGQLAEGLQPGTSTGQSHRGLVYLGSDEFRMERKLQKRQDRVLVRLSVTAMCDRGLRLYLSGRGDVLSSDPVPAACFQSVSGWAHGTIRVLWVSADGPPPGSPAAVVRPPRAN